MRYLLVGVLALLLVSACSGSTPNMDSSGQDRMLRLRGYDIKESDYRAYIAPIIKGGLGQTICESAKIKTDDERAQKLVHPDSGVWPLVPPDGTVQPSRDAVYEDALRAVQITSEECANRTH